MSGSRIELKELIQKYLAAAGDYGKSVALTELKLSREEIEDVFGTFDEDYHISRFFHFSESDGQRYSVNGETVTHVSIDSKIQSIL